jgi:undecaprenyl-diphosphatase
MPHITGLYRSRVATLERVDWSVFHALNGPFGGNDPAQDVAEVFNAWAIFLLAAAAAATWLIAPPYGDRRWKVTALGATAAALIGLVVNSLLGQLWNHPRPFVDHPHQTVLLVHHGADNSFPSDHATVAFAIAFTVLAFHRRLGGLFLVAATLIALDRMIVGVHYPIDVMTSALVGFASALLVATAGRRYLEWVAGLLSRATDPVLATVIRRLSSLRRAHR